MAAYPHDSPLLKGDRIGGEEGFVIEDFVGGGGFAYIYKVYDLNRRCMAAMKVLRPSADSSESRERFEREILVLGHLSSNPHTPNLIRRGMTRKESGERALDWFVMDYVEGITLKEALEQARQGARLVQGYHFEEGRMHPLDVLTFLRMVVRCLEQLHTLEEARMGEGAEFTGYVHRDLKSVNVMLPTVPVGYPAQVMVLDFGIAGAYQKGDMDVPVDHQLTMTGSGTYTPKYAAPEQIVGTASSYGPFTDFYTLGMIAYECLTGEHPYDDLDMSQAKSREEMLLRTMMPSYTIELPDDPRYAGVAAIVNKMLRHRESERPATARELYMMLAQVQENPVPSSYGPPSSRQEEESSNRSTQDWSAEAARLASQEFDETQVPREAFFKLEEDRKTKGWRAVTTPEEGGDRGEKPLGGDKTDRLFPPVSPRAKDDARTSEPPLDEEVEEPFAQHPIEQAPDGVEETEADAFLEDVLDPPPKKTLKMLLVLGMLVLASLGVVGFVVMQNEPPTQTPHSSRIEALASSTPPPAKAVEREDEKEEDAPALERALLASQAAFGASLMRAQDSARQEALRKEKADRVVKTPARVNKKKKESELKEDIVARVPEKAPAKAPEQVPASTPSVQEEPATTPEDFDWANWKVK